MPTSDDRHSSQAAAESERSDRRHAESHSCGDRGRDTLPSPREIKTETLHLQSRRFEFRSIAGRRRLRTSRDGTHFPAAKLFPSNSRRRRRRLIASAVRTGTDAFASRSIYLRERSRKKKSPLNEIALERFQRSFRKSKGFFANAVRLSRGLADAFFLP